jgi:hypothetical protein
MSTKSHTRFKTIPKAGPEAANDSEAVDVGLPFRRQPSAIGACSGRAREKLGENRTVSLGRGTLNPPWSACPFRAPLIGRSSSLASRFPG